MVTLDNFDTEVLGTSPPAKWVRDTFFDGGPTRQHIVSNTQFSSAPHSMKIYADVSMPLIMGYITDAGPIETDFHVDIFYIFGNGIYLELLNNNSTIYNAGNYMSGFWIDQFRRIIVDGVYTGVTVSNGWHSFRIRSYRNNTFDLLYDDATILAAAPMPLNPFGSIKAIWVGVNIAQTAYFDNFTLTPIVSTTSALGRFILGRSLLGTALGSVSHLDAIKVTESIAQSIYIFNSESLKVRDVSWVEDIASLVESIEMAQEFLWYPALDEIGIQVRITQPIDITMDDFCDLILEAGHAILLNTVNARAFVNVQQKEQTFRGNVKVYPGDAVMFSCPTLDIHIGDTVTHAFRDYEIIEIHEKLIGGNYIYYKSALKLKDIVLPMPKVTGLKVTDNLEGAVLLTWNDISKTTYPSFDHFEIWRSGLNPITAVNQTLKTFSILGEYADFFVATEEFDIIGSTGNNGTYTVVSATQASGVTTIKVVEVIPSAVADGLLDKLTFRLATTVKTTSWNDKSLVANNTYYYVVRAVDKYGNLGEFSEAVMTTGDSTSPTTPEGFR